MTTRRYPELRRCGGYQNKEKFGRIRELKVNGATSAVGTVGTSGQHKGIGTNMLKIAEEIAYKFGMTHVTVTSAVGVRDYYKLKHGYELDECGLMWKKLDKIKLRKLVKFNNSKTKYEILMNLYEENKNPVLYNLITNGGKFYVYNPEKKINEIVMDYNNNCNIE